MPHIPDIDIYRTANELVKRRGDDALAYAERQLSAIEAKGDADGATIWRRVMTAIMDLWREEPGGAVN